MPHLKVSIGKQYSFCVQRFNLGNIMMFLSWLFQVLIYM